MPSIVAVAALPSKSPGVSPSATESLTSIAGIDFAALLLQLGSELGSERGTELPTDTLATTDSATSPLLTETTSEPLDPALFLAAMGLAQQAAGIQPPESKGLPASSDLPALPGANIAPAAIADSSQKTDAAPGQPSADLSEATLQTDATALQGGTPAKLAGFEQKLADAVQTISDTAPTPQQTAVPQQTGTATNALRQGSEAVRVEANLRDHAWPAEFGQKVVWMATQDKQSAQITLNPPQLGPIEISLNVKNDQATAVFASGNAEVREAIESALPRLREMLAGVGVELGQTNVSSESFRQTNEGNNNSNRGSQAEANHGEDTVLNIGATHGETAIRMADRRGNGLVDTFA